VQQWKRINLLQVRLMNFIIYQQNKFHYEVIFLNFAEFLYPKYIKNHFSNIITIQNL
jgi:hypothetical protein